MKNVKLLSSMIAMVATAFVLSSCCCDRDSSCEPCPRPCAPKPCCKPCPKPCPCPQESNCCY